MLGPSCFGLPAEKQDFWANLSVRADWIGLNLKKSPGRKICEAILLSKGAFRRGEGYLTPNLDSDQNVRFLGATRRPRGWGAVSF
jgi:hypothetical protein